MLIDKALESIDFAHALHWHLELEKYNLDNKPKTKRFYVDVWNELMDELGEQSPELWKGIREGRKLKNMMNELSSRIKEDASLTTIDARKQTLREEVATKDGPHYMEDLGENGLQSPLDPQYTYSGVVPPRCTLFTSAIQPILFMFKAKKADTDNEELKGLIFKQGDDLR